MRDEFRQSPQSIYIKQNDQTYWQTPNSEFLEESDGSPVDNLDIIFAVQQHQNLTLQQLTRQFVFLILNLSTGVISPQFHVIYDDEFTTVDHLESDVDPSNRATLQTKSVRLNCTSVSKFC